jgi:phospholipid-binding lipoprotein MlaA
MMSHWSRASKPAMVLILTVVLSGCATAGNPDPWEPVNRKIFSFNQVADAYVLEPVSKGYTAVVPQPVRTSIGNVLYNLREPAYAINSALQGEREAFGTSLGRLVINTTLGLGGLFDAASAFGYNKADNSFGSTLQKWGVDQGPYVVLPLWGPNTVRGTIGFVPDAFMNPVFYLSSDWPGITQNVAEGVDFRSNNMQTINDLRSGSVDMYATVRSIFLQRLNASTGPGTGTAGYDSIFEEDDGAP